MKKFVAGAFVVLALTFGLASYGESVSVYGCIRTFGHRIGTGANAGKFRLTVTVRRSNGALLTFAFHPTGIKKASSSVWLTFEQLAAWEPIQAKLRAATIGKYSVQFEYNSSTDWVFIFRTFPRASCT